MKKNKKVKSRIAKNASGKKSATRLDIIKLILEDHKALKGLIKIMKNSDKSLTERQAAFKKFAPLLITHAKPEEETLYVTMKESDDMREEAFEGDVEHGLADQMLTEAQETEDNDDLWCARVKVLAELVEHHIKEEEEELLPNYKNHSELSERVELANEFLRLKAELKEQGSTDTPSEKYIEQHMTPQ